MKIAIAGLWHLGTVTAACLAKLGLEVIAYDRNAAVIKGLQDGQLPIYEPELTSLINNDLLTFTSTPQDLSTASIVWVTYDTPVDDDDNADINWVENEINLLLAYLAHDSLVLISSQLPVGTTRRLYEKAKEDHPQKNLSFAYSPENLRLGKAIDVFLHPDRIIVGILNKRDQSQLAPLLKHISNHIIWMSLESAEMTKHAINAFLATSIAFINELATLCEQVNADANQVAQGLKSDQRIGSQAYLKPGNAFAGGTLARDVKFLLQNSSLQHCPSLLINATLASNELHKNWIRSRICHVFTNLNNMRFAIIGLAYKSGTNTLRRSNAIETAHWLYEQGAHVCAYDPVITQLPNEIDFITLYKNFHTAIEQAEVIIMASACAELDIMEQEQLNNLLHNRTIIDPNGFIADRVNQQTTLSYFTVGKCQ